MKLSLKQKSDKEKKRKKNIYIDPKARHSVKKMKMSKIRIESDEQQTISKKLTTPPTTPTTEARTVRSSTRDKTLENQAERDREKIVQEKRKNERARKKSQLVVRRLTQEELLADAKITEQLNIASFEALKRVEEEKKKLPPPRLPLEGPLIRYHSKGGITTLTFTQVTEFPTCINSKVISYPKQAVCETTGLPAKYRDPKTGIPYATPHAFKIIRSRFVQQEEPKDNLQHTHTLLEEKKKKKIEYSIKRRIDEGE